MSRKDIAMIVAEIDRADAHAHSARRPAPASVAAPPPPIEPGVMRLTAVRDRSGHIVDFVWAAANAAAARMMYCTAGELPGKHLRDGVAGPLGHPVLVERYRRVIEDGNAQSFAQVHLLDGTQDIVDHRVARDGDGVIVTLTNRSAQRRARERHLHSQAASRYMASRMAS
jgi:hypothetical protein